MTPRERFIEEILSFKVEIRLQIEMTQQNCPHENVLHDDGFRPFGTYHPERLCLDCGLREQGGWWCYTVDCPHWHNATKAPTCLAAKSGRTIKAERNLSHFGIHV